MTVFCDKLQICPNQKNKVFMSLKLLIFTLKYDIMNAKAFIIYYLKPLQIRKSKICSLHIGQLYHNAALL